MTLTEPTEGPEADQSAEELADRLRAAGAQRAAANRHTLAGMQTLEAAYTEIRVVAPEAKRAGIPYTEVARLVGLSRAQLYNIITRKTGL